MEKVLKTGVTLLLLSFVLITACSDDDEVIVEPANPLGTLDFTRYIAVGNSLTAGFQSGALLEDGQNNSFPKLITEQVGATDGGSYTMKQPTLPYPGIGNEPGVGVLELTFDGATAIVGRSAQAPPTGPTVGPPYHNLGVPLAYSTDITSAVSGATSWLAPLNLPNGFFDLVVQGKTQAARMTEAAPTFVTLWIGNNDVINYALRGGDVLAQVEGIVLTDDGTFEAAWNAAADAVDSTGAKVITANIPNVTDIPHFTTVPFQVPIDTTNTVFVQLQYVSSTGDTVSATSGDLILLAASSLIGVPDSVTQIPFGLSSLNPLPSSLVLDAAEQTKVSDRIASHNSFIQAQAATRGWGFVDVNAFFAGVALNGVTQGSTVLTTDFITGDLFSLDGIHPTGKGYGILANEFLKEMDRMFGATITKVDISTLPGVQTTMAKLALNKYTKTPIFSKHAFDDLYRIYGVQQ